MIIYCQIETNVEVDVYDGVNESLFSVLNKPKHRNCSLRIGPSIFNLFHWKRMECSVITLTVDCQYLSR